jgi:F-type H+-transporting ATPase subunit epsilon
MWLDVLTPTKILISEEVHKVIAEAQDGSFALLPRHIDFAAALVPGLLSYVNEAGQEVFLAVDEGILVKQGAKVRVSTRQAVKGEQLETLIRTVQQQFMHLDEREKQMRSSLARLEADFVRRFVELGGDHG